LSIAVVSARAIDDGLQFGVRDVDALLHHLGEVSGRALQLAAGGHVHHGVGCKRQRALEVHQLLRRLVTRHAEVQ
jgi:hypothetical protein